MFFLIFYLFSGFKNKTIDKLKITEQEEKIIEIYSYFEGRYNPFQKWQLMSSEPIKKAVKKQTSPAPSDTIKKKYPIIKPVKSDNIAKVNIDSTLICESDFNLIGVFKEKSSFSVALNYKGKILYLRNGDKYNRFQIVDISEDKVKILDIKTQKSFDIKFATEINESNISFSADKKNITKPDLKIQVQNLSDSIRTEMEYSYNYGVKVLSSDNRLIFKNDIIMSINNQIINKVPDVFRMLNSSAAKYNINLWRNGKEMNIEIK